MKTFEEIYTELAKEHSSNAGETFAKAMFEAGRDVSFTQNLQDAVKDECVMVKLLSFTAMIMAERAVKMNAADLSISTELTINDKRYFTRLSSITFKAGKKPLEKRAHEIAKNIFKINEISSIEDVQAMLEDAVLAGYNLRKEDFEED